MKIKNNNIVSITDDFLAEDDFVVLRDTIIGDMAWYFSTTKVDPDNEEQSTSPGQFIHTIYDKNVPNSPIYDSFVPMLKQLEVDVLIRIKMNLNPRLPEPFYSLFHIDFNVMEKPVTLCKTSIFYINTNNGYTEFEDGTKAESVANRLVSFQTNTKHRGVTQTDEQTRIVINFNYLKLFELEIER